MISEKNTDMFRETGCKMELKTGSVGSGSQIAAKDTSLVGWWKLARSPVICL